jgi:hypothetical protein
MVFRGDRRRRPRGHPWRCSRRTPRVEDHPASAGTPAGCAACACARRWRNHCAGTSQSHRTRISVHRSTREGPRHRHSRGDRGPPGTRRKREGTPLSTAPRCCSDCRRSSVALFTPALERPSRAIRADGECQFQFGHLTPWPTNATGHASRYHAARIRFLPPILAA